MHGADLEASLEELETVYILLVKHLHAEFGRGAVRRVFGVAELFLEISRSFRATHEWIDGSKPLVII